MICLIIPYIVDITVEIPDVHSTQSVEANQETREWYNNTTNIDESCNVHIDDPCIAEIEDMKDEMHSNTKSIPISIISPLVCLTWMYLCEPFRQVLDFNFTRNANFDGDFPVRRFNDTRYVQKHDIWDWHEFILLPNGELLYKGLIIRYNHNMYYIVDVDYELPDYIQNASNRNAFRGHHEKEWWFPKAIITCRRLINSINHYTVLDRQEKIEVDRDSNIIVIDAHTLNKLVYDESNQLIEIDTQAQDPDVRDNKPFFFVILGFDGYHHTNFCGKRDWDTHGVYWWIGNMNSDIQFSKQLTFTMGQIPDCVNMNTIGRICFDEWIKLIRHGALLWTGTQMERVRGMISHQIADMKDRDHLMRRRGYSTYSRSDGCLWQGCKDLCKWPNGVNNLFELNVVAPGPYLLKIWKYLNYNCIGPQWGDNFASNQGFNITLTEVEDDIYNELPIASSIKSTIELNHTTLLGCTVDAFKNEWYNMHRKNNLDVKMTRNLMGLYLEEYFNCINGIESLVQKSRTKLNVWNAMHNSWQKLVEILIAAPNVTDWYGNLGLVIAIIRITGALFNVETDNERKRLQTIVKPILNAS